MHIKDILKNAVEVNASDIFIVSGAHLAFRINNQIQNVSDSIFMPEDTKRLISEIFEMSKDSGKHLNDIDGEIDFSFSIAGLGRFRVNVYRQRGSLAAVLRCVSFDIPDYRSLNIPENIINLCNHSKGIVLVTGSAGSGKSTTLSCMVDRINHTKSCHIITLEDPIEFLHRHDKSIISQREIYADSDSYVKALRAALRQSPNVILLGEMRDYDTINIAMTAAETGQLILSTLHTIGAANTIDRIIDVFPANQQHQIRIQLSMVLQAVVSQQLIPSVDGGLVPAFEIMTVNNAIKTMIREEKTHQIDTFIQTTEGMQTMDMSILKLYNQGQITAQNAIAFSINPEMMQKRIKM